MMHFIIYLGAMIAGTVSLAFQETDLAIYFLLIGILYHLHIMLINSERNKQ